MTGEEHYRQAELFLDRGTVSDDFANNAPRVFDPALVAAAQTHATLALVAAMAERIAGASL